MPGSFYPCARPGQGEAVRLLDLGLPHDRQHAHRERVQLVEHPLPPRALARRSPTTTTKVLLRAPGPLGVQLGDEVLEAGPGDLLFKPAGSRTRSGTPATSRRGCRS